jgi:hypothetical protein
MSLREITFPEPTTKNANGLWGLAEWLLESMSRLTNSAEDCDVVAIVAPKLIAIKGPEQGGKKVRVTETQHEKLREVARPLGTIAFENIVAVSGYLKALHMAAVVSDEPEKATDVPQA